MNDQRSRYRLIVTILVGLGILLAIYLFIQHKRSPAYITQVTSRDTGETVDFQPNVTQEKQLGGGKVIIFGGYLLTNNGATQNQFQIIKDALNDYSEKNLRSQYKYLTFMPGSFVANGGNFKSKLRLGDSNNIVETTLKIWDLNYAQIKITDTSGRNGGNYDSGALTAS